MKLLFIRKICCIGSEVVISMDFMVNFPFQISTSFVLVMYTFPEQDILIYTSNYFSLLLIFAPHSIE
jgi:hypothetical protein